jgi:exodeoxyribonuclease VII small subunit
MLRLSGPARRPGIRPPPLGIGHATEAVPLCAAPRRCYIERVAEQAIQGSLPKDEARYEEIVQRLTKVVERLEGGGLSLEESIAAFEEGIQLARAGAQKLEEAERKVETLLENDRTVPFSPDEGQRR